ncbi:hypothetical protein [Rhizobium glycinendophyticum]|uniref:Uncharacterized protein n=1 Tax=Rhizobium glycinendophyticum TaxID=2589807 RepID=A0A504UFJ0_9HYPH|nr:hypothetical protein [Rhizobium glycinendophyticum]TPP04252.1 hypothetical protein FJQ55_22620 [Rhizobium glycinendophyticum]
MHALEQLFQIRDPRRRWALFASLWSPCENSLGVDLVYLLGESCLGYLRGDDLKLFEALPEELVVYQMGDAAPDDAGCVWFLVPPSSTAKAGRVFRDCLIGVIARAGALIVDPLDVDVIPENAAVAA